MTGEGFPSVPPVEIPPPPPGSIGELFAMVEERSAELRRLAELEPELIRARKMLDGRDILRTRAEGLRQLLGYCMLRYCDEVKDAEFTSLAHLVRDTCEAMTAGENRAIVEALFGSVALASLDMHAKGLTSDDGLRRAGRKALTEVGLSWEELKAKLANGERVFNSDDETG
jgi:hypothetical protein